MFSFWRVLNPLAIGVMPRPVSRRGASSTGTVTKSAIVVAAWAGQRLDGSIQGNGDHDVFVDEMVDGSQTQRLDLSITEARQLAEALLEAADTANGWLR